MARAAQSIAALQKQFGVSVVLHRGREGEAGLPAPEANIQRGDTIVVAAPIDRMNQLEEANRG